MFLSFPEFGNGSDWLVAEIRNDENHHMDNFINNDYVILLPDNTLKKRSVVIPHLHTVTAFTTIKTDTLMTNLIETKGQEWWNNFKNCILTCTNLT